MRSLAWVILVSCVLVAPVLSDGAAAQQVEVEIVGGSVQLQVSTAPPGQNPPPATDASTTLRYSERTDDTYKILVSTSAPDQDYDLRATAMNPGSGMSQGEVSLIDGMSPVDLITQIDVCDAPGGGPPGGGPPPWGGPGSRGGGPPCRAEATLRYRAFVEPADGPGSDSHTVQYTIVAQ